MVIQINSFQYLFTFHIVDKLLWMHILFNRASIPTDELSVAKCFFKTQYAHWWVRSVAWYIAVLHIWTYTKSLFYKIWYANMQMIWHIEYIK